jgi:hypothetical protein
MVNINKLKGKIVECGLTVEKLADEIQIDRSTLYRKINNKGETFTIKEANQIAITLKLTATEVNAIFLANMSRKMRILKNY